MEDEERKKYENLIERLVFGWIDDKTGKYRYFKPRSSEERAARNAAARLLTDLAHSQEGNTAVWLYWLATLFGPASRSFRSSRDITFKQRREGNPGMGALDQRIAREMVRLVLEDPKHRGAISRAVKAVAKRRNIEERESWRIWSQHGRPVLQGKPRRLY